MKLAKTLVKKQDDFLTLESLIKQVPQISGPGPNKAGKFWALMTHNKNVGPKSME